MARPRDDIVSLAVHHLELHPVAITDIPAIAVDGENKQRDILFIDPVTQGGHVEILEARDSPPQKRHVVSFKFRETHIKIHPLFEPSFDLLRGSRFDIEGKQGLGELPMLFDRGIGEPEPRGAHQALIPCDHDPSESSEQHERKSDDPASTLIEAETLRMPAEVTFFEKVFHEPGGAFSDLLRGCLRDKASDVGFPKAHFKINQTSAFRAGAKMELKGSARLDRQLCINVLIDF